MTNQLSTMSLTDLTDLQTRLPTMSISELTAIYNQATGSQLKKFSTKADGVRRVGVEITAAIAVATPSAAAAPAPKAAAKQKKNSARPNSISAICRSLIAQGFNEQQAHKRMLEQFDIPASKLNYFRWNVNRMKRDGRLPDNFKL